MASQMQGYAFQEFAGKSLLEKLWEELDVVMDRLMADGAPPDKPPIPKHDNTAPLPAWRDEWQNWGQTQGQAQGLAFAIAVIQNAPNTPNVPAVKDTAMDRYYIRNGIDPDQEDEDEE